MKKVLLLTYDCLIECIELFDTKSSSAKALDEFAFCYALCERLRLKSKLVYKKLKQKRSESERMFVLDAKQMTRYNLRK